MPISEVNDYILLMNEQIEAENGEQETGERERTDTPTIKDVFRGSGMPHL